MLALPKAENILLPLQRQAFHLKGGSKAPFQMYFDVKDILPKNKAEIKYEKGHHLLVLCKFSFQNQDKYFSIYKEIDLSEFK